MREAVIVAGVRTPIGRANRGTLKDTRPEDLAALVINESIKRADGLKPEDIDDVILGCAFPEGEQGMNIGRIACQRAGLPSSVPGYTVNRFCSSGLQSIALAASQIQTGAAEVILAGGVESMSMVPMGGNKLAPNPYLADNYPEAYINMGLTAENVAERFNIKRDEMDTFAAASHQKAAKAIQDGKFKDEIIPVPVKQRGLDKKGRFYEKEIIFDTDEGVRPDSTAEGLGKLRPVFKQGGVVTAGNSSQINDGAAAVVVMSKDKAEAMGLTPLVYFKSFAVGGVDADVMGIGPVVAIPKALELAGLKKEDIDVFELNEAFAAQALACIKELGLDDSKINFNGGAIALGHPLGCTGAKLTVTLIYEMMRQNAKHGAVSMCIGGGMGAAGIFERR